MRATEDRLRDSLIIATLYPHLVLGAYATGVFPMADSRDAGSVFWVEPRQRAILPLDRFRVTRSLRKTIAADRFRVTADAAFADILALCAESVPNRPDTWIRSEEHTSELQSLMRISYAVFCLKQKNKY